LRRNIAIQFFKETIMHHETSQEITVGISQKEFTDASHCELKKSEESFKVLLVDECSNRDIISPKTVRKL
jgi:hypothetical protein